MKCLPWQFDCQFGSPRCIAQYKVNDGAIDCYTGFDEGCPSHYFICHDRSACIDFSKYQDGIPHCRDKSDEPCQAGYFLCNDRTKCIEGNKFQDNTEDCSDGSDEECTVTQFECPCGKVRCIDVEKIKDGKKDCEDGADETGNLNPKTCPDGIAARVSKAKNRTVQLTVHNAIQQCQKPDLCRENLGETCIMISGMPHCVCKKGTVKPSGFTRCVSEQRLQQYLNNIIANCSNIANDLIETYNSHTEFNVDPSIEPKVWNISCDPQKEYSCKGVGEVCKTNDDGKAYCMCKDGQPRIDGICLVNECADPKLNDCDPNASCMDSISSYECFCNEGFIDVSSSPTTRPGVNCTKLINECSNASLNDCDAKAECIDKPIGYTCRCMCGYNDVSPGGARNPVVDECKMKLADCDPQALCTDLVDGYECRCPIGFSDVSPDPTNRPGRICAQMVSDCSSPGFSGCNPHTSQCVGTNHGFVCRCMKGFIDLNPAVPGVNCLKPGTYST
uniref:EGF-like domain-containing protein n=1 Tax=Syphacia muris TaxID=451379 RepID=A0A0N5AGG8_9BILA